jgi:hypothetical protein
MDQTLLRPWLLEVRADAKVGERRQSRRKEDCGQLAHPFPYLPKYGLENR